MLERFKSMTWKDARAELKENPHLLALTQDEDTFEVAKTVKSHGVEAGLGVMVALLFFRENGAINSVKMALQLYERVIPKLAEKRASRIKARIWECQYWCGFVRSGRGRFDWPMKPGFRNPDRIEGVGNVLLFLALREFIDGSTCEVIAAQGIYRFLSLDRRTGQ